MIIKQDIINNALMAYGDKDFKSGSVDILNDQYRLNVKSLLAMDYWIFAQVLGDLGLVSDDFEFLNFKYKYLLPADLAKLFAVVYNPRGYVPDGSYQIVGSYLYSNFTPLKCRYVSDDVKDAYPPHFAEAISYRMAYKLCVTYGSPISQDSIYQLYRAALTEATIKNGQEVPSIIYRNNYYSSTRVTNPWGFY